MLASILAAEVPAMSALSDSLAAVSGSGAKLPALMVASAEAVSSCAVSVSAKGAAAVGFSEARSIRDNGRELGAACAAVAAAGARAAPPGARAGAGAGTGAVAGSGAGAGADWECIGTGRPYGSNDTDKATGPGAGATMCGA